MSTPSLLTADFDLSLAAPNEAKREALLFGIFIDEHLPRALKTLDNQVDGAISNAINAGHCQGKLGQVWNMSFTKEKKPQRIFIVGLGEKNKLDRAKWQRALTMGVDSVANTNAKSLCNYLHWLAPSDLSPYLAIRDVVTITAHRLYRYSATKSENSEEISVRNIDIALQSASGKRLAAKALTHGLAIAEGVALTRNLGDLPANLCTPTHIANQAVTIVKGQRNFSIKVLGEKEIRRLKMGAFLSVTQGSEQPPKLIYLHYRGGNANLKPVVLLGKGITFDTGGISLKPREGMEEMKYDMCGAATVLGVFRALRELRPRMNVVGIIPTCENMPSGRATRPGDVVTSMAGKTIEILNTDAEGRLILCDALNYALRFKPKHMIDIATLTGACVIALGAHRSGLMSNNDQLAEELFAAGERAHDRIWRLPLDAEYHDALKTPFADMANVGGRSAGAITAGCFLAKFVNDTPWAHLDIAGTAWGQGDKKGATGKPVALLVQHLLEQTDRSTVL